MRRFHLRVNFITFLKYVYNVDMYVYIFSRSIRCRKFKPFARLGFDRARLVSPKRAIIVYYLHTHTHINIHTHVLTWWSMYGRVCKWVRIIDSAISLQLQGVTAPNSIVICTTTTTTILNLPCTDRHTFAVMICCK